MGLNGWAWWGLFGVWALCIGPGLWRRVRVRSDEWQPWHVALGGEMEGRYEYLREVFEGNASLVHDLLGEGPAPQGVERTCRSLSWGLTAVDAFAQTAMEHLAEWRALAKVVDAEVPGGLARVRLADFRVPSVRRLAGQHALTSPIARALGTVFDAHLLFLGRGFAALQGESEALLDGFSVGVWRRVRQMTAELAHDFTALSRSTLGSARLLLAAMERQHRRGERPRYGMSATED